MNRKILRRAMGYYTLFLMGVFAVLLIVSIVAIFTVLFSPNTELPPLDYETEYALSMENADSEDLTAADVTEFDAFELPPVDTVLSVAAYENQTLPQVYSNPTYTPYPDFTSEELDFLTDGKRIIVLDPGHQSIESKSDVWLSPYLDPAKGTSWVRNHYAKMGTQGVVSKEYEYTYTHAFAEKLKAALQEKGYTVYLTKDDVKTQKGGAERARIANEKNADLMISLHCDGYDDRSVHGSKILAPKLWEGYPSQKLEYLSFSAAQIVLDTYVDATGQKNLGITQQTKTSMYSFCKVPVFLLELGFMSNAADDRRLHDDAFQEKMIEGIVLGVGRYLSAVENGISNEY